MIRWLWSRVMKWGWDYGRDIDEPLRGSSRKGRYDVVSVGIDDIDSTIELPDPITFRVQAITGGTLVETRWYDPKNDEPIRKLHIVNDNENLAEAIGKIVTMELIRK
jgi:hypothetical protein